jgi:uncharacterized protein (DUF3084 family)
MAVAQLTELKRRVQTLEEDSSEMKADMDTLKTELGALRVSVQQVDLRSITGEKLMMSMQLEQRRQAKLLERIAVAVHAEPTDEPSG